jgi:hypothetical protein
MGSTLSGHGGGVADRIVSDLDDDRVTAKQVGEARTIERVGPTTRGDMCVLNRERPAPVGRPQLSSGKGFRASLAA